MKISKRQLRQIIREEYTRLIVRKMINEAGYFDEKYASDRSECVVYVGPTALPSRRLFIVDGDKVMYVDELKAAEPDLVRLIDERIMDYIKQTTSRNNLGTEDIERDLEELGRELCQRVCGKPCRVQIGS